MPALAVAVAAALADFELPAWCWWAEEEASAAGDAVMAAAPFELLAELVAALSDIAVSLVVFEAYCLPVAAAAGSCSACLALDYLQVLVESRLKSSWIAVAVAAAEVACTVADKAAAAVVDIPFESADKLADMARHS